MKPIEIDGSPWWKSSFSTTADCVAVREASDGGLAICNSNHPDAGVLVVSREDMAEWLARIKNGALDDLVDAC
jgi:hypothetical protein